MNLKFSCLKERWVQFYLDGEFVTEFPIVGFTFFLNGCLAFLERFHLIDVYPLIFELSPCLSDDFHQVIFDFSFSDPYEVRYVETETTY